MTYMTKFTSMMGFFRMIMTNKGDFVVQIATKKQEYC